MKKVTVALAALVFALVIGSNVQAGRHGMINGDCGNCNQTGAPAQTDQFRKFQSDTIDLRQELMVKRFEIQRENLKATPDDAKVAALQSDLKAIQAKIYDLRVKSGLPEKGMRDGDCGRKGKKGDCSNTNMGDCGGPCGGR